MVLIMSVEPGAGGQAFIPSALQKIRDLKEKAEKAGAAIDIEVDGGIRPDNVMNVLMAGANVIVSGTSIFHGDIMENVNNYNKKFKEFEEIIRESI